MRRLLAHFYPELLPAPPSLIDRVKAEREATEIALLAAHNEQERADCSVAMFERRKQRLDDHEANLKGPVMLSTVASIREAA
jgi:hypothetical protein